MRAKLFAAFTAVAIALSGSVALARVVEQITHRTITAPAPSPSPSPSATPLLSRLPAGIRALPPLPPLPAGSGHIRHIRSATGACIVFSFNAGCAASGNVNENFVAGATITWNSADLPTTGSHQDYVLIPGNAGAPTTVGTTYTGATGTAHSQTGVVAGVYVFASLNTTTNAWDAIAYVLVGSAVSIETYSDGTLATKTQTFTTTTSGTVTVFIAAEGLNAQDMYTVGVEDQLTGKCVFTAPNSSQTTTPSTLCKLNTATLTGTNPTGSGLLLANWGVTLATAPALPQGGTYVATVFDQSTGQRVASRLFTVIDGRSTASTARVNLEFHNNVGTTSTSSSATRIAWNGTATNVNDTSQTYMALYFGATGLPVNTDNYQLVITDPTGTVAKEFTNVNSNYGTTTITPSYNQWNLPTQSIPFEQAYPGSTWTATIYDSTLNKLVAEQSFQVLGYSSTIQFTSPSTSTTLNIPSGNNATGALTFTNTSDNVFGANNGDPEIGFYATDLGSSTYGITNITLQGPGQNSPCTPTTSVSCTATYSDTSGNTWEVVLGTGVLGGNTYFTFQVIPSGTTISMAPGASVTVTGLTFYATACTTQNACVFTTSAIAKDSVNTGVAPTGNAVSNQFYVTNGAAAVSATASVALAGYYDSGNAWHANQDAGYTPRFNQAVMTNNQPFTGAASKVVLAYTVKNTSTYPIQIFDVLPPSAFNLSSAAVDSHSPNGFAMTDNGYCDGVQRTTLCITPSTTIAAGATETFDISFTPPSSSFSYSDIAGTIVQSSYNGYNPFLAPISPATSSVSTFIGSPTTVDSTAIGSYSLSGGLMTGGITPGSVGTNTSNTLTYNLRNTPTSSDPFPDEVDFVALQIPNQTYVTVPTSCSGLTVGTSGWSCVYATSGTGQPTTYYFGQCPQQVSTVPTLPATSTSFGSDNLTVCPFAAPNEPYSLTAGAVLSVNIPVTAGATATSTPITISSWAHGATTDAWSTPVTSSLSVNVSASAGVGFYSITAPGGGTATVPQGTQPQIVGNYVSGSNTYVYKIKNTGGVNITSATIGLPGPDTTGTNGQDSSGNIWKLTAAPILTNERTSNANGCTATYQNPANGLDTTGNITITCPSGDFISGDTLDVQFTAVAPLKINSTYNFPATINGSSSGVASNWYADTQVLIALSASVSIAVNSAASCPAQVVLSSANLTVNFGQVAANTTVACPDAMIATVNTDSSNPSNWALYVSTSGNPTRTGTGAANELLVELDTTNSTSASSIPCPSGITAPCFSYDNTSAYTAVGLTSSGTGTRLGYTTQGGTGVNNGTVKFYTNWAVSIGTETVPGTGEQETITYTWIAN